MNVIAFILGLTVLLIASFCYFLLRTQRKMIDDLTERNVTQKEEIKILRKHLDKECDLASQMVTENKGLKKNVVDLAQKYARADLDYSRMRGNFLVRIEELKKELQRSHDNLEMIVNSYENNTFSGETNEENYYQRTRCRYSARRSALRLRTLYFKPDLGSDAIDQFGGLHSGTPLGGDGHHFAELDGERL